MPPGPSRKRVLEEPLAWQGARQRQRCCTPEAVCRLLYVVLARGSVSQEQQQEKLEEAEQQQ